MRKAIVPEVESIVQCFGPLQDPRSSINQKHLLGDLIVISICAVIAGADGPKAIGLWALANQAWLLQRLKLPNGIPSHDTIGRLLALLKPQAFQSCFQAWIATLTGAAPQGPEVAMPSPQKTIAIDGKALRRSHDRKNKLGALFLVSAWSVESGVSLGQLATEAKSNEITAIPELIENIDVSGAIVTIDAAGCQKNIAAQIINAGGDYVFSLKGNQGKLHKAVAAWFTERMANCLRDTAVSHLSRSRRRTWPSRYLDLLPVQGARGHSRLHELEGAPYHRCCHSRKPPGRPSAPRRPLLHLLHPRERQTLCPRRARPLGHREHPSLVS